MGIFSFGTKNILLIDIGTSSVGFLALEIKGGEQQILNWAREDIEFEKTLNHSKLLKDTVRTLKKLFDQNQNKLPKKVDEIHCFLASPWFISQRREISYKKQGELFTVKKSLIDELIQEGLKTSEGVEKKEHKGKIGTNPEVLEAKIIDIKLNGYSTDSPEGKETNNLELSLLSSLFSAKAKEAMVEAIDTSINYHSIKFHTFPAAALCVLRDVEELPKDFVILDVNGEITDVILVKDGTIAEIISFPLGKNFFWRELSERLGTNMAEAKNTYELFNNKKIQGTHSDKIVKFLSDISAVWVNTFTEAVKSSSYEFFLPGQVYLIVSDEQRSFYEKCMSSDLLASVGHTNKPFNIIPFDSVLDGSKERSVKDINLYMESLFINRLFGLKYSHGKEDN